jgi:hypothetical protein
MLISFKQIWKYLENEVFGWESTPTMFNQYNDYDKHYDIEDSHIIRRKNLQNYFTSFNKYPSYILIGEAPGPNGCRFSGVPFTNEKQLVTEGLLPFKGQKTSLGEKPYSGTSANIFWETLKPYHPEFIAWDCIPFHPHYEGDPLSIRTPRRVEIREHLGHLVKVISLLSHAEPVAIGRKAQSALKLLNRDVLYIRHPARGGKPEFIKGILELW